MLEDKNNQQTNGSKFKRAMHYIFVKNIGLKIFAVVFSVAVCIVVMGIAGV